MTPLVVTALIVVIFVNRMFMERAFRKLDDDAKLRLMNGFSRKRMYSLIPFLAVLGICWYLTTQTLIEQEYAILGFLSFLLAYVIINSWINQRILCKLDMPQQYRSSATIAQIVSITAVAGFFYFLFGTIF